MVNWRIWSSDWVVLPFRMVETRWRASNPARTEIFCFAVFSSALLSPILKSLVWPFCPSVAKALPISLLL